MCLAVNGHAVRVGSEKPFTDLFKLAPTLVEDRDDSAFCRNVKPTQTLVKGQHVGISAHCLDGSHFFSFKIKDCELRIALASHERQPVFTVYEKAVAFTATRQRITTDYLIRFWIDLGEIVLPMHRNKDMF